MKTIDLEEESEYHLNLEKGWKVFYDYEDETLYVQDPQEIEPKELTKQSNSFQTLIPLNKQRFLSISEDGEIILWNSRGKHLQKFENDTPIIKIAILSSNEFATINSDNQLSMWHTKKSYPILSFENEINSFDDVEIDQGFYSFKNSDNSLDIYREDGEKLITFKNQTDFFKGWTIFSNNMWLTSSYDDVIVLWSADGEHIANINHNFHLIDDIYEMKNDNAFVIIEYNTIYVYDYTGKEISLYEEDDSITKDLKKFIKAYRKLTKEKKEKNNILDFKHVNNPSRKKVFIPTQILEEYNINLHDAETKYLWNFFNRPLFSPIKTLLQSEEKSTKRFRKNIFETMKTLKEDLEAVTQSIQKIQNSKKIFGIITLISLALSTIFVLLTVKDINIGFQSIQGVAASILMLILFFYLWNKKRTTLNQELSYKKLIDNNLKTLKILMPETETFIQEIKAYRNSILKQIPIIKEERSFRNLSEKETPPTLYSGVKVQEIIQNKLRGEIQEMALSECGITEEDIIYSNSDNESSKEVIILHDWSYIQDKRSDDMAEDIIKHNELSFWSTKTEGTLFAVQYIQYIFLTKDKIDVFNTYYDFITNQYISKQSFAYYYKDVTNISKKDVKRIVTTEKGDNYSATEIMLQVSSGDSIKLTIINPDTMKKIQEQFSINEDHVTTTHQEELAELEEKYEEVLADTSLAEDDKQDTLELIRGNIQQLQNSEIIITKESTEMNKANRTIQNIRAQLKNHKLVHTGESIAASTSEIIE